MLNEGHEDLLLLLRPFAIGDVAEYADLVLFSPKLDWIRADIRVEYAAILSLHGQVFGDPYFAPVLSVEFRNDMGKVRGRMDVLYTEAKQFFSGVSEHLADGIVGLHEFLRGHLGDEDPFIGGIENTAEPLLGFPQGDLGPLPVGDVADDGGKRWGLPWTPSADGEFDREFGPVLPQRVQFDRPADDSGFPHLQVLFQARLVRVPISFGDEHRHIFPDDLFGCISEEAHRGAVEEVDVPPRIRGEHPVDRHIRDRAKPVLAFRKLSIGFLALRDIEKQPVDIIEGTGFVVHHLPPVGDPPDVAVLVPDPVFHAEDFQPVLNRFPEGFLQPFPVIRVDDPRPIYGPARELLGGITGNRLHLGTDKGQRPVRMSPVDHPWDVVYQRKQADTKLLLLQGGLLLHSLFSGHRDPTVEEIQRYSISAGEGHNLRTLYKY